MTTPMQSLKNQFDEFKSIVKTIGFEEISLNKSEPKTAFTSFCGENFAYNDKGVKSDFIKMFKIKFNKENAYSIGFAFNYLDLKQEDFKVNISLKKGVEEYLNSKEYSVQDCKIILNSMLKKMKECSDLNYEKVISFIKENFALLPETNKKKIGRKKKM